MPSHLAARALLSDPLTNKGTAFSEAERDALGLHGLLPPHVGTLDSQIARRRRALDGMADNFQRYAFLRDLQDSNEVLFHALVQSDLPHMLPLVYTPTVGDACERFSEIWRRSRGLFLSYPNRHRMAEILSDPAYDRVKVIVVSDGERVLGLGDQGAGGMGIPIGKLALYTACAGFHPAEVLPILLDVGTDNVARREDPLYIGWREARVRGAQYDAFIEMFVAAVEQRLPGVLLQWEDFAGKNAYDLLGRYRHRLLSFNDDIQGTAATAVGTLIGGVHRTGLPLARHTFVLFGAGAAGQFAAFDEHCIREMARHCEHPVIFPLSNPISRAEANPADVLAWTEGRAIVGSGSPFGIPGVTQVNNVYIFPGVGLGALAAGAREVTDGMFLAAARCLGRLGGSNGSLLPEIANLRLVAREIAVAVALQAMDDDVATITSADKINAAIDSAMWEPRYSVEMAGAARSA